MRGAPRLAPAAVLAAVLAAVPVVSAGAWGGPPSPRSSYADPSVVIAAELAFARDARVRGQWTAFAATAASDAVMFVPQMVWAQPWLKGRANPPVALRWQPREVWSSCDGSLVLSHGTWQQDGAGPRAQGWFTTLWQRQPGGDYKWVLDHGDDGSDGAPLAEGDEPDMIAAHVADCPPRRTGSAGQPESRRDNAGKPPKAKPLRELPPLDPLHRSGTSLDRTLRWEVTVTPAGGRTLAVTWTKDGADAVIRTERVAEPPASR